MNIQAIQPHPGLVLVKVPEVEKKTSSGIIMSNGKPKDIERGEVISVGDDYYVDNDTFRESGVEKGDVILFANWERKFTVDEVTYIFLRFEQILGTINTESEKE